MADFSGASAVACVAVVPGHCPFSAARPGHGMVMVNAAPVMPIDVSLRVSRNGKSRGFILLVMSISGRSAVICARHETNDMARKFTRLFCMRTTVALRFAKAREGATVVEFAMIAPIFIALLLAIFQTTIFLFAQQTLQNAAVAAGRLIMTGQIQNGNVTQSQFATDVCPMVSAVFTCSKLMINVQSYTNFSSASTGAPTLTYNSSGQVTNSWSYSVGTPGQVMVVQLVYQWPIVSGPIGSVFTSLGNGYTEMMGVTAFRIEPY
jgi:Flp pilus assembly protein TadG